MLDVGWGDLIDYFGDDPATRAIVIYMESIGDARAFLSAAREVALTKPIVVIKAGRSEAASRAATSHTGALTGSDEVLDAAFRRAGVLRVNAIEEVFDLAEMLGKQPRPVGPRLTIVTNAGGPACSRPTRWSRAAASWRSCRRTRAGALDAVLPRPGATATRSTCWATRRPIATSRRWRSPRRIRAATGCWSSSRPRT
jgi:acetyltransferase